MLHTACIVRNPGAPNRHQTSQRTRVIAYDFPVLEFVTAGESHGKGLHAIVTGFPAGVPIDNKALEAFLKRRQGGYGRSVRQQMESDRAEFLGGVRKGRTTGNPITLRVKNKASNLAKLPPVTRPRPGPVPQRPRPVEPDGAASCPPGCPPPVRSRISGNGPLPT